MTKNDKKMISIRNHRQEILSFHFWGIKLGKKACPQFICIRNKSSHHINCTTVEFFWESNVMARFIFNSFLADPFELKGIKNERYLESKECVQTNVQNITLLMFCYWNSFIASDGESARPLYIGPGGSFRPPPPWVRIWSRLPLPLEVAPGPRWLNLSQEMWGCAW